MNFSELGLTKRIAADLEVLGFVEPTEIQQKAIPAVLAGRDVMASAETGSGKTAAYALPIIQSMKGGSERRPRALVLVPTRELALQVESQFERFSNKCGLRTVTVYGGVGMEKQTRLLRRGVDVVVATPGRLFDHIERGNADLSNVKVLVLDEADRMLDMGFTPQVRKIVETTPAMRQTIMFSATINKSVEQTADEFLTDPVTVRVNTQQVEPSQIEQRIFHVDEDGKDDLLVKLIKDEIAMTTVLVFAKTRRKATKICKKLRTAELTADEIHGDISQHQREKTLTRYRAGEFTVLVATDIAARGLDIPAISHVVNYDLPMSASDYVHRIGRTGRAGRSGVALSFVSSDQRYLMREIEKVTGRPLDPNAPPEQAERGRRSARPGRSSRNTSGSGHRRRPENSAEFGGGVFSKRREPREAHSTDRGRPQQSERSFGKDDSRRNYARASAGASSKTVIGHGESRQEAREFQGDRDRNSKFRSSRSDAGYAGQRDGRKAFGGDARREFARNSDNRREVGSDRKAFDYRDKGREFGSDRKGSDYRDNGREFRAGRNASDHRAETREFRSERSSDHRADGRKAYGRDGAGERTSNRAGGRESFGDRKASNFGSSRQARAAFGRDRGADFDTNREGQGDYRAERNGSFARANRSPSFSSRSEERFERQRNGNTSKSSGRIFGTPRAGKPFRDGQKPAQQKSRPVRRRSD